MTNPLIPLAIEVILRPQPDPVLEEVRRDLLRAAVAYAHIRAEWFFLDPAARVDRDAARTRAHNALIDALNIFTRQMLRTGLDTRWREGLGDDRKVIGDLACQLHAAIGIACR